VPTVVATAPAPAVSTTAAPAATTPFALITVAEIGAFADKLAQSGTDLPPAERTLLQVLVQRARTISPAEVRAQQFRQGLTDALRSVIEAEAAAWGDDAPEGWAKIDPIWYKSGVTDPGVVVEAWAAITTAAPGATAAAASDAAT
jgi:hypothetical protein